MNDQTMQDLDIHNLSTIHLVFRLPGGSINCKISLADSCGMEINVNVSTSEKIAQLKQRISLDNANILPDEYMRLTYQGRELLNFKKISECNIEEGKTIVQERISLGELIPQNSNVFISYDMDIISYDDAHVARAKMPCGHVISSDSLT